MEKMISAIATANGVGGVAIIRVSGEGVLDLTKKMFTPLDKKVKVSQFEPYKLYVGEIDGGDFTDFGMVVYFKAPKSYTGEDMVEFHCHGGTAITQGILKRTFELGSIPATRGEFTKRAFVNGKLSLDGCEGLIDMINSESVAGVKVGYNLYREKLFNEITAIQEELTYALASIDADIDYPEEDLESTALTEVEKTLLSAQNRIKNLLSKYSDGKKIKNGVKVVIIGQPNTGKSSILNALLNCEKAIVSSIEGTTRDVVEGSLQINGVKFDLYDTAGIHATNDELELLGIERSNKILKSADIVVVVFDGTKQLTEKDADILKSATGKEIIKVFNKKDLEGFSGEGILLSAVTGEGIDELKCQLYQCAFKDGIDLNGEFIAEERHYYSLKSALNYVGEALKNIGKVPLDFIAEDIKAVWLELGEITGKTASEEIIDEIFSKFCVGK